MVRVACLSLLAPVFSLIVACTPFEQRVADDDRGQWSNADTSWNDSADSALNQVTRYRGGMVITDNGDGTWEGEETAAWTDDEGISSCEVIWSTTGTVDIGEVCEGCVASWDVTCSSAVVLTAPSSCDEFYGNLDQPAQFWVGFLPGYEEGTGTFMTGDTDDYTLDNVVYWGDHGTASFDGATMFHDTTWDVASWTVIAD